MKGKIIEIDEKLCDGCGECLQACAERAITIVDGKARLVSEIYCDGLGACLGECPKSALKIVEREAEEFDPGAVEEYLRHKTMSEINNEKPCRPSMTIVSLKEVFNETDEHENPHTTSKLTNWPIQLKLLPPTAHFLKEANLFNCR